MSKHKKAQRKQGPSIPFNRFHSDMVKESKEEARRRASKEAKHFKKHPNRYLEDE